MKGKQLTYIRKLKYPCAISPREKDMIWVIMVFFPSNPILCRHLEVKKKSLFITLMQLVTGAYKGRLSQNILTPSPSHLYSCAEDAMWSEMFSLRTRHWKQLLPYKESILEREKRKETMINQSKKDWRKRNIFHSLIAALHLIENLSAIFFIINRR